MWCRLRAPDRGSVETFFAGNTYCQPYSYFSYFAFGYSRSSVRIPMKVATHSEPKLPVAPYGKILIHQYQSGNFESIMYVCEYDLLCR